MSCLVGIGTILLQSAINTLGTTVIVAHTAARKVFELVSLPNSVLGSAMATYCGQNYGARRFDRIRQGIRASLLIAAVWAVVVFLICHTIEGKLIQFVASTTNPDVIYWGSTYLKVDMSFIIVWGDHYLAQFHAGFWRPGHSCVLQLYRTCGKNHICLCVCTDVCILGHYLGRAAGMDRHGDPVNRESGPCIEKEA